MTLRLLLLLLALASPAYAAEEASKRLSETQQALEAATSQQAELNAQSTALSAEVNSLRDKLIRANDALERSSSELDDLESSLADLEGTAARRSAQLDTQRQQMAETLAVLQRLARTPPAAQLLSPTPPLERLRTDMQLKALLPEIEARSAELAATVADLRVLKDKLEGRRAKVVDERQKLARQQKDLDSLMDERTRRLASTRQQSTKAQERAEQLAKQAQDLRELAEKMAREPEDPKDSDGPTPTEAKMLPAAAARLLPVNAPVLLRFGEKDRFGNVTKGLTLRPRPGAAVAAIANGRVAFAGPFRGYGRVMILAHGGEYHTVLAGLGRITVEVGQRVAAGEPVGTVATTADPAPELYFEVRHDGAPVDPLGGVAAKLTQARQTK